MDYRNRLRPLIAFLTGLGTAAAVPVTALGMLFLSTGTRRARKPSLLEGSAPFIAACFVSAVFSPSRIHAVLGFVGLLLILWSANRFAVRLRVEWIPLIVYGMAAGLAFSGVVASHQVIISESTRASTFFPHPNLLGGALAPALLFTIGAMPWRSAAGWRVALVALCVLLGGIALLYTGSRGALFGAAAGAIVQTVAQTRDMRLRVAAGLALAGALTLSILLVPEFRAPLVSRLSQMSDLSDGAGRPYIWAVTLEAVRQRPFVGHGFESFTHVIPEIEPAFRVDRTMHSHNLYLQLLLDGGWLTLFAFVYWAFRVVEGLIRERIRGSGAAAAALAAASAIAVHSMFDPLLYHGAISVQFLLVLAVGLAPWPETATEAPSTA